MAKRPFMPKYKTYDDSAGRGSAYEWKSAFHQRMGLDEARRVVGDKSSRAILGVTVGASWVEVKSAYRRMARRYHPDVCQEPDAEAKMKDVNAAYEVLEWEYEK